MNPKHILISLELKDRHLETLKQAAGERAVFICKKREAITEEDLKEIDGIIGNISPSLLTTAPKLRWVQLNSAGADPYVKPGVLPDGCILRNAVGAYGLTVSEHMLALTLSLVRKLELYLRDQVEGRWADEGSVTSIEGSTVLVLGLGDIGGSYARKMKALGAYVIGVRRSKKEMPEYLDEQYTFEELPEVLGRADLIAAALPSTPQTVHLFSKETFALLKKGAYLINCGRGDLIEFDALKEALEDGILAGAALDVTDPEPLPADDVLWTKRNVIITPHVAGGFHLEKTFDRIIDLSAAHLAEWLDSEA